MSIETMAQINKRDKRIKELEEENKRLKSENKANKNIEEIIEVLKFYASEEIYISDEDSIPGMNAVRILTASRPLIGRDRGKVAKDMLKKINRSKK